VIMSDKKYYYLVGIPRAGNTLFASIMNQNPKVAVTANSMVCDIFCGSALLKGTDVYQNYPDEESLDNVVKNIIPNYYSHWKTDCIIDRSVWGLKPNFDVLKKHAPNDIKIIVLVRDIAEVLASFVKFSYSNETNYIARNARTKEERCDYIMKNGGELHKWIQAVYNLTRPENKEYVHLIEYNDLVNNTEDEINKVYDYLDIPKFKHHYSNLSQLNNNGVSYNDDVLGGELHTIKTEKIEKSDYDVNDYLPKYTASRYQLRPFWRENN